MIELLTRTRTFRYPSGITQIFAPVSKTNGIKMTAYLYAIEEDIVKCFRLLKSSINFYHLAFAFRTLHQVSLSGQQYGQWLSTHNCLSAAVNNAKPQVGQSISFQSLVLCCLVLMFPMQPSHLQVCAAYGNMDKET